MDAYLASTVTPSLGTALFHMNRDIAAIEARHAEEIKQAVREAYEDAAQLVFNETMEGSVATAAERSYSKLREKAGKL